MFVAMRVISLHIIRHYVLLGWQETLVTWTDSFQKQVGSRTEAH